MDNGHITTVMPTEIGTEQRKIERGKLIMEVILNATNVVLTFLLGIYVLYINRRPEVAKVSHSEVMSLLKEKHLEALEWWSRIDKFIVQRQEKELRIYLSIINKKISDDQRDIDPKVKALEIIDNFTDAEQMKVKEISDEDEDIETVVFISKITENAVSNINSLKYYLPKNFVELLDERQSQLLMTGFSGLTRKDRDSLDNSIRFIYKYLKIIEISYYSGINNKLNIDKNDLILTNRL